MCFFSNASLLKKPAHRGGERSIGRETLPGGALDGAASGGDILPRPTNSVTAGEKRGKNQQR